MCSLHGHDRCRAVFDGHGKVWSERYCVFAVWMDIKSCSEENLVCGTQGFQVPFVLVAASDKHQHGNGDSAQQETQG